MEQQRHQPASDDQPNEREPLSISTCQILASRALELCKSQLRTGVEPVTIAAVVIGHDLPLVYVSGTFEWMTGYSQADCLGMNCRFLQGRHTAPASVDRIRSAIADGVPAVVKFINYRKDGRPFVNGFQMDPLREDDGTVKFFVGTQKDISISSIYDRVDEWNTAQVCQFLEKREFQSAPFVEAQVDGSQLLAFSRVDFDSLGITGPDYDRFQALLEIEVSYRNSMDEFFRSGAQAGNDEHEELVKQSTCLRPPIRTP